MSDSSGALQNAFQAMVNEVFTSSALYSEIGELLSASIQKNFDNEGRYGALIDGIWQGGKNTWKPLSASRIKQRTKKGHWPGKILQDTGGLKSSINYVATRDGLIIGSGKTYAEWLTNAGRPFIVIQNEDLIEIEHVVNDYFGRFGQ
jgi:phage gpG-like protein